jgi:ketosteroid isomerase-like protein
MYRELTRRLSGAILPSSSAAVGTAIGVENKTSIVGARRNTMVTIKDLEAFGDGWNRHDVDFLMTFMSDDCVFETTAGREVCGTRYEGRERVREAFAKVFKIFPDAHFGDARHFVAGDRGVSEWRFTGTTSDGRKVEVNGCDLFTFRNGKIAVKNSYFKNRTV